ncbi:MAG TPA: hypothetical protein VK986_20025, partial [Tepidisphaeraceae bacterium]|nr:hypothetical protein [Tepidisphaeraceae bacterium]
MTTNAPPLLWALLLAFSTCARAQETVDLVTPADPKAGWGFDNGREFDGGAGGGLDVELTGWDGKPALKLRGDFAKGGRYVQVGRKLDKVDVTDITLWLRNPGHDRFTLRLTDSSGQAHQLAVVTERVDGWQQVTLPLRRFYANRGKSDAVTTIAHFESWGGKKDGNWHGPATGIYIIAGKTTDPKREIWLGQVTLTSQPPEQTVTTSTVIRLDEIAAGEHDWTLTLGQEVKGAKGSLGVINESPTPGGSALRLSGDFTGGGAYVAAIKDLKSIGATDVSAVRFKARTSNASSVSVQIVDSTGQTHQKKGIKIKADGQWNEVIFKPTEIAGGEHWGGAKDGKWHGPPTRFVLSVTGGSDPAKKQPVIDLADIRADATVTSVARPAAYSENFSAESLPNGWTTAGDVTIDKAAPGALLLARTLDDIDKPISATGPTFPVSPGRWQIGAATRADLKSDDSSYNGVVALEALGAGGKVLERFTVADVFRVRPWQEVKQTIELPAGATAARFHVQINKAHGQFRVDDLSARYLASAGPKDDRVSKILFATAQLGNLLFPDSPRTVDVTVEAKRPLADTTLHYVLRDYWGAEQVAPASVKLGQPEKKGGTLTYLAKIDLAAANLELGRYYEVHAWVSLSGGETFKNHTSLAVLPEAVTRKFKPEEIPFTGRSWDNRSAEHIRLTDRLGIRICGLWGGWKSKPPYEANTPGIDLVKELGMGWVTGTPAAGIERGSKEYDEAALRTGVKNLIEKYGHVRPMIVNLGNEPHGTGDKVKANVAAYKALYEAIKQADPTVYVVATAVEPNEEYFKLGYGRYCDAFDFHIYESAADVRRTMREYKALMQKYDVVKPLWSTELGLNSQGIPRHVVAAEVPRKLISFFAEGGKSVSWFCTLYPDPEGKNEGSSGQSHNLFDSRFNRYCPKLDAVSYYNVINAVANKKFVAEREYPVADPAAGEKSIVRTHLFRDGQGNALQTVWADRGSHDVALPLPGVKSVDVIRIDGVRRTLTPAGDGASVTLTVSEEPLLLLYDEPQPADLPAALAAAAAAARVTEFPKTAKRGQPV